MNKDQQKSVPTITTEVVQPNNGHVSIFFKNLEFFRKSLGVTQAEFCGILTVSSTMYDKYRQGSHPSQKSLSLYADKLSEAIANKKGLASKYPLGILPMDLNEHDFSLQDQPVKKVSSVQGNLFPDKFVGVYYFHYMATNQQSGPDLHFGVIRLTRDDNTPLDELSADGVFHIKFVSQADNLHEAIRAGETFENALHSSAMPVFRGKLQLSATNLWGTLVTEDGSDFVDMSFDLSSNFVNHKTGKPFYGCRGIALSQTMGVSRKSITFPVLISKEKISVPQNELKRELCFNHTKNDLTYFQSLSEQVLSLIHSLDKTKISEENKEKFVAQALMAHVEAFLDERVYNNHSYTDAEMDDLYKRIIRPTIPPETDTDK